MSKIIKANAAINDLYNKDLICDNCGSIYQYELGIDFFKSSISFPYTTSYEDGGEYFYPGDIFEDHCIIFGLDRKEKDLIRQDIEKIKKYEKTCVLRCKFSNAAEQFIESICPVCNSVNFTVYQIITKPAILVNVTWDEGFDINATYIKSYGGKIVPLFYGGDDNDKINKLLVNIGFEKVKNYDFIQYIDD